MDVIAHWLALGVALCRSEQPHLATLAGSLPLSLFLVALVGSASHCVGMCGPFVLGQVAGSVEGRPIRRYGEWQRLAGAALAPYHLGRLTTYVGLGAIAGSMTSLFAATSSFAWASAALLAIGAALLMAQALGFVVSGSAVAVGPMTRFAAPLAASTAPFGRYGLGVILGFLPCGLVYAALAAAGASASAVSGALAMAAFGLGTVPALVAVGWGGLLLKRRLNQAVRWIAAPLLLGNAAVMLMLAVARLAAG